jgi:hypothetical protein
MSLYIVFVSMIPQILLSPRLGGWLGAAEAGNLLCAVLFAWWGFQHKKKGIETDRQK